MVLGGCFESPSLSKTQEIRQSLGQEIRVLEIGIVVFRWRPFLGEVFLSVFYTQEPRSAKRTRSTTGEVVEIDA